MRNIRNVYLITLFLLGVSQVGKADPFPGLVNLKATTFRVSAIPDTISFRFYSSPNASQPVHRLSFYFDHSRIPRKTRIAERNYHEWFSPISFNDDTTSGYFTMYLTCCKKSNGWLQVILNEETGETAWIQESNSVHLIKWNQLDSRKYSVTITNNTQQYFLKADSTSQKLKYADINCFELIRIKGDWMLVSNKNSEMCDNYDRPYLHKAWIRFKTPSRLLIDLEVR